MAKATAAAVTLEYDTLGPRTGRPLLIIQGLGDQMIKWSDGFHQALVERGFFVIRFDNRDAGLSTHLSDAPVPDLGRAMLELATGRAPSIPYRLEDMAADAAAVLDAVGVPQAHIMGISMGGMIAQLFAINFGSRVLSLTSIMSSTGNRALPPAKPEAMAALTSPAPDPSDEAAYLAHAVQAARAIGSPGYPEDENVLRANLTAAVRRSYDPAGFARQVAAIVMASDRRERLGGIKAPTLIIHGAADPLVPIAAGEDTAMAIPGSTLLAIEGMGHNLPRALYERVANAISEFVSSAEKTSGAAA